MAGPLSTNEIEDVLSSVRRLVSTEQRPRVVSRDPGEDKLLLTPSLRVVAHNAATKPDPEPLILSMPNRVDIPMPPEAGHDDRLHLVEAEWEDQFWTAPEPPLAELALGAEEAVLMTSDSVAAWPEAEVEVEVGAGAEMDWVEEPANLATAPHPATEPSPEPIVVPNAAAEQEPLPQDDLDVAEMLTAAVVEDATFQKMSASELHDLVRAMVRDELQGNLGERITRNVRKLVRAEINRALAARDLD